MKAWRALIALKGVPPLMKSGTRKIGSGTTFVARMHSSFIDVKHGQHLGVVLDMPNCGEVRTGPFFRVVECCHLKLDNLRDATLLFCIIAECQNVAIMILLDIYKIKNQSKSLSQSLGVRI